MDKNFLIKNLIYNNDLNNELWDKMSKKEKLTTEEHNYVVYCYHYEEAKAGLL